MDTGYSNVEQVISALVPMLPESIPMRAAIQFRIDNLDYETHVVYERTKG